MINVAKPGEDKMELRGTKQLAYSHEYGQSTCAWVGSDKVLTVPFEELRPSPIWTAIGDVAPTGLPADDLRAINLGQFGHFLHGYGDLRNGGLVTTRFVNDRRVSVTVPIRVHDVPLLGDVSRDVHFDLALSEAGGGGGSKLSVENVDADSSDLLGILPSGDRLDDPLGDVRHHRGLHENHSSDEHRGCPCRLSSLLQVRCKYRALP